MKKNQKKSTIKKHLCITLITLFFLAGTSSAQAHQGRGYCSTDWTGMQPGLNLTQDQTKAFNDLQGKHVEEVSSVRQAIVQKQLESDRLFLEASPDASRLTALQKEIAMLQAQMGEKSLSYQLKARKLLTAEQLTLVPSGCNFGFNTMSYDRPAGYGYGGGHGHERGHGRGYRHGCRR